ncbi:MAG: AAA family ATPase [Gemmataceae bacterium]
MIRTLADSMGAHVQPRPVHPGPDAVGYHWHRDAAEDRATGQRAFRFLHGPIFANVVLADEINRTPPKTQAVPEAMQERQVTGSRHLYSVRSVRAGDAEPD